MLKQEKVEKTNFLNESNETSTSKLVQYKFFNFSHHQAGMVVLFLHDISDVLLEVTKMNTYLKKRAGRTYAVHDVAASVSFCLFALSW